ncbi:MAG: hypothetical protein AB7G48_07570 [Nitrospiraceae bacterium]
MNCAPHSRAGPQGQFLLSGLILLIATVTACNKIPFAPATVVPTKTSLPYAATVELTTIGAFLVQPGATMSPDPNLQNRITAPVPTLTNDKEAWEQALIDYVASRGTFRTLVVNQGPSNVRLAIRMLIYIDPSLGFKFNTIYVARATGTLSDAVTGRVMREYSGFGKSVGVVRRTGTDDDKAPVNQAVHSALGDLFGKLEGDRPLNEL